MSQYINDIINFFASHNYIVTALIGVAGVFLGAVITGFFQTLSTKRTLQFYEKQFKSQNKQFSEQLEIQKKQLKYQEDQINEQRKEIEDTRKRYEEDLRRKGKKLLRERVLAGNNRKYDCLLLRLKIYTQLYNELAYIGQISASEKKEQREKLHYYPRISNEIGLIIRDLDGKPENTIKLAEIRSYIDEYNSALDMGADSNTLEALLKVINSLVVPINTLDVKFPFLGTNYELSTA